MQKLLTAHSRPIARVNYRRVARWAIEFDAVVQVTHQTKLCSTCLLCTFHHRLWQDREQKGVLQVQYSHCPSGCVVPQPPQLKKRASLVKGTLSAEAAIESERRLPQARKALSRKRLTCTSSPRARSPTICELSFGQCTTSTKSGELSFARGGDGGLEEAAFVVVASEDSVTASSSFPSLEGAALSITPPGPWLYQCLQQFY